MDDYKKGYEPAITFGKYVGDERDDAQQDETLATVAFLERLADGGPALELGIGTGRIALPLAERQIRVDGIEISTPVVERLRERPGGDQISVTIGNFADVPYPDSYPLIYLVANALLNLYTQEDQIRCFEHVAAHLTDNGAFVVEVYGPAFLHELDGKVRAHSIDVDTVKFEAHRHDAAKQIIEWSYVSLSGGGVRLSPIVQRYAWPSELDLMARMAGLRLRNRWGGWNREPFNSRSMRNVSVYGR